MTSSRRSTVEPALSVSALTKSYGTRTVLDDLTFTIGAGSTCALVGPNGAGKTTLISILLGLIDKDSGDARVFGDEAGTLPARENIGYLPDVPSLPGWMRADEVLTLCLNLSGKGSHSVIESLLEAVGLKGDERPVRTYSRGMKQRLGLAQALVSAPDLLILDEPTSALDPAGQHLFHGLVQSLKGHATVLYSTHSLNEAERVCDSAIVIDRGRLVRHAPIKDLIADGTGLTLEVSGPVDDVVDELEQADWVTHVLTTDGESRSQIDVTVTDMATAGQRIPKILSSSGAALHSLRPRTLEEIFLDLTGEPS